MNFGIKQNAAIGITQTDTGDVALLVMELNDEGGAVHAQARMSVDEARGIARLLLRAADILESGSDLGPGWHDEVNR